MIDENTQALIIESNPLTKKWDGLVNLTTLTKDGKWMCGINLLTSLQDIVERADQWGLPIITRTAMEKLRESNETK